MERNAIPFLISPSILNHEYERDYLDKMIFHARGNDIQSIEPMVYMFHNDTQLINECIKAFYRIKNKAIGML
jgi:hypothetical protein